jgi:hypothetical protein
LEIISGFDEGADVEIGGDRLEGGPRARRGHREVWRRTSTVGGVGTELKVALCRGRVSVSCRRRERLSQWWLRGYRATAKYAG